jgi:3-oxoacyl-[acyl-carrier protein] reductase
MAILPAIPGGRDAAVTARFTFFRSCKEESMAVESSRNAIVTGGSGGIGQAVAQRLAHDGFGVVVSYAGNAANADKTVAGLVTRGGRGIAVQANIANPEDVECLFDAAAKALGTVDVVVHCAGIMPLGPIGDNDVQMFDRVIATNLRGTFLVLARAAQRVTTGGRIIAFSSSVLAKSFPGYGAYIASKAGVEGLVHVLANELRGKQITVNAVAPGPVATDLFLKGKTNEQIQELGKLAPLERLGQPEDIANVVSFLAGPDGAWINAQILRANGGFA